MSENEAWYDAEIAPALMELAKRCLARNMALVAVVEYESGSRGKTVALPVPSSLEMLMLSHCAKTVPNVDAYVIGLLRYAREHDIAFDSSIVMSRMGGDF